MLLQEKNFDLKDYELKMRSEISCRPKQEKKKKNPALFATFTKCADLL